MTLSEKEMIDILHKTEALEEGHFLLSSGLHSNRYVQCAKVFQHPDVANKLCEKLANKLNSFSFDKIVGPAMGGILPAYEISKILSKPNVFAERKDGKMKFKRGFKIEPEENLLVIEDVVTTGGSAKEVIEEIEKLGGKVTAVSSIINRTQGEDVFEVPYISLLQLDINNYEPSSCPLCEKNIPLVKPGSR